MSNNSGFDLEKYAARREASRSRMEAARRFEEGDCVPTIASVAGSFFCWLFGVDIRQYYTDIDTKIHVQLEGLKWRYEHLNDDYTGYGLSFDCGPVGEGLVFDCEVLYPENTSPWIKPFITKPEEIEKLELIDPRENPRVQEHLREGERFVERVRELGYDMPAHAGLIGIHPPISCATAIAEDNLVYMLMYDEPKLAQMLLEKCYRMYCMLQEYRYELTGQKPGSLGLADDNSAFVSDALYREFILPLNLSLYEKYGPNYRSLHADGPNEHHYETYAHLIRLNHMDIGGFSKLRPAVEILKPAGCVIHGNLNNRDLYAGWTEELQQKIRQTIRIAAPGGGYEFAIGGETYAGTDPEVLCKTFDYARQVGKYPIDLPEEPLPGEDEA